MCRGGQAERTSDTLTVMRWGLYTFLFKHFPKQKHLPDSAHPPSHTHFPEICASHVRNELNGILKRGVIITSKFIHNIAQKEPEDSHIPSLFLALLTQTLSGDKGWKDWGPLWTRGKPGKASESSPSFPILICGERKA